MRSAVMEGSRLPIYTYRCNACGGQLEVRQSFSEPALTNCQLCGGALRKVLHPVGVIFKGSGFYNTDYRAGGNGSKGSEDGAADKTKDKVKDTVGAEAGTGEASKTDSTKGSDAGPNGSKAVSSSKTPATSTRD
jgi:putative FmdB family regulatory protein